MAGAVADVPAVSLLSGLGVQASAAGCVAADWLLFAMPSSAEPFMSGCPPDRTEGQVLLDSAMPVRACFPALNSEYAGWCSHHKGVSDENEPRTQVEACSPAVIGERTR